jgi:methionine synthase II (cobalamin-independent)
MSLLRSMRRNRTKKREKAVSDYTNALSSLSVSAQKFTAAVEQLDAACRAAGVSDEKRLRMLAEVTAIAAKGIENV